MSGSTGKSVSATGVCPGVTTNRSCLPHASHRKATILPSGDQAGADGYLICEMRSMVMLPRGDCETAAGALASSRQQQSVWSVAIRIPLTICARPSCTLSRPIAGKDPSERVAATRVTSYPPLRR